MILARYGGDECKLQREAVNVTYPACGPCR